MVIHQREIPLMFLHRMNENLSGEGEKFTVKGSAQSDWVLQQKINLIEELFIFKDSSRYLGPFSNHPFFDSFLPLHRVHDDKGFSYLLKIGLNILNWNRAGMHESMAIGPIPTLDISHFKRNHFPPK